MSVSSFTCPVCGRTSYNPNDVRERYCGACHGWTAEPPPPGMRWIRFDRADGTRFGRLLVQGRLERGSTYSIAAGSEEGEYAFDGERFVEQPRASPL